MVWQRESFARAAPVLGLQMEASSRQEARSLKLKEKARREEGASCGRGGAGLDQPDVEEQNGRSFGQV